jgi:hypothetical protein
MIRETLALDRGNSLWDAHVRMALEPDDDKIIEIIRGHLNKAAGFGTAMTPVSGGVRIDPAEAETARIYGGPFEIVPAMMLVARWGDALPAAALDHVKRFMTEGVLERGNTENHWLMYYAGNLLAAERWSEVPLWWNGLPPAAMHTEARRWILGMIARTATIGHYEYDSTGYHNEHFVPYLALAEHARDRQVREQAGKMVLLLLADMALEYFHGAYAGGHSREGNVNTWTQVGPGQGLNYLYFGDEEFDPERHCQGYATPAVAARFRPPALLARLALDRDTPHVVRKTKPPRAVYRHVDRPAQPVRKYTWMSRSFALGSTQTGLPGAPAGPIDLTSWDLTWRGPRHRAKVCCNHPYRSFGRFSAFLPELPQRVGRGVATRKPYLQVPDRLFGASPYERMMQHEGLIVVLYRIPADDEVPYVNCFLPKGHDWREQDGWLLGDMGNFYVAVRILGDYRWEDIHEDGADGNWIDGWLLRVDDRHAGLVLEAAEADAGGFEAFRQARQTAALDLSAWPDGGRVTVDSFDGVRLEMSYDGPHLVDGTAIDYEAYPLFDAPGVEAPLGTGCLTFAHDGDRLDLDFDIDPAAASLPMRVIG